MKMSRKISKNDRLLRDKIIHQEWKQDRDLIKKVIKYKKIPFKFNT